MQTDDSRAEISHPLRGQEPSVHQLAIFDAGRAMLLESLVVGRDFCKFMIGFGTGAVPIYLSLVKFFLPEDSRLTVSDQRWILAPVLAFALSAMLFVFGYMPTMGLFSVESIGQIEQQRSTAIKRRFWASVLGFLVFVLGLIGGAVVLIFVIPEGVL